MAGELIFSGDVRGVSLESYVSPVKQLFDSLDVGQNVLIQRDDNFSLLKYDGFEVGPTDPLKIRANRDSRIYCLGNILMPLEGDLYTHPDPARRIAQRARIDVLGTHRIDFDLDSEFNLYLPSAENHADLYLTLANQFGDGRIEKTIDSLGVFSDESLIVDKLERITRSGYFEENVVPFLESRSTGLEMPGWSGKSEKKKGFLGSFLPGKVRSRESLNIEYAQDWLSQVTKGLDHGDFVYVGSKEEVYLLGVAKNRDGSLFMQGTYTASTKPMLYFSNNCLGHMSLFDMQKGLIGEVNGSYDPTKYRTFSAPGFGGEPFIFSSIGRSQDYKNSLFTGEPELITGDLNEALSHFRGSGFSEFGDVVEDYAKRVYEPTPGAVPDTKEGFFC